ncbi:STAS domain-containing protein [Kineococcus sp. LSe6-4]|uniref:STAS domain-containing protein n=1 Tax=Kineococcus halophytocola TaxID=3234027 RepID=A0ABV4H5S7_9ACTN
MTSGNSFPGLPGSVVVRLEEDPAGTALVLVALAGEVDMSLAPELERCVDQALAARRPVVVDADAVTFMDSTGLGFLARLASRSGERRITVRAAPEHVRHLVHRARLDEMIDLQTRPGAPA